MRKRDGENKNRGRNSEWGLWVYRRGTGVLNGFIPQWVVVGCVWGAVTAAGEATRPGAFPFLSLLLTPGQPVAVANTNTVHWWGAGTNGKVAAGPLLCCVLARRRGK